MVVEGGVRDGCVPPVRVSARRHQAAHQLGVPGVHLGRGLAQPGGDGGAVRGIHPAATRPGLLEAVGLDVEVEGALRVGRARTHIEPERAPPGLEAAEEIGRGRPVVGGAGVVDRALTTRGFRFVSVTRTAPFVKPGPAGAAVAAVPAWTAGGSRCRQRLPAALTPPDAGRHESSPAARSNPGHPRWRARRGCAAGRSGPSGAVASVEGSRCWPGSPALVAASGTPCGLAPLVGRCSPRTARRSASSTHAGVRPTAWARSRMERPEDHRASRARSRRLAPRWVMPRAVRCRGRRGALLVWRPARRARPRVVQRPGCTRHAPTC